MLIGLMTVGLEPISVSHDTSYLVLVVSNKLPAQSALDCALHDDILFLWEVRLWT